MPHICLPLADVGVSLWNSKTAAGVPWRLMALSSRLAGASMVWTCAVSNGDLSQIIHERRLFWVEQGFSPALSCALEMAASAAEGHTVSLDEVPLGLKPTCLSALPPQA